jgi:hypothetical protein
MLLRRFGRPGLLGLAARTAVVAGTATVTATAIGRHQMRRAQEQQEASAYEQSQAAPPAAPEGTTDLLDRIKELSALHDQGALNDAEFAAAKAKLLA